MRSIFLYLLLYTGLSAHAGSSAMMAFGQFQKLPRAKQVKYIKEIRQAAYELEKNPVYELALLDESSLNFSLIPEAHADSGYCLIGGVRRSLVNRNGRTVCPTYGRGCSPYGEDGFECGVVYNRVCVSRNPLSSLSSRCNSRAGDAIPSKADYQAKKEAVDSILNECESGRIDSRYRARCPEFAGRVQSIQTQYAAPTPPPPRPVAQPPKPSEPVKPPEAKPEPPPPAPAPAPAPAPVAPAAPPAPKPQPPAAVPVPTPAPIPVAPVDNGDDCKALYGLVIEGTGSKNGDPEIGFHNGAAKWADAYSKFAEYTSIIPPEGNADTVMDFPSDYTKALQNAVAGAEDGKLCERAGVEFSKYMLGEGTQQKKVGSQELLSYRLGQNAVADGKKVKVERGDITSPSTVGNTELMRKIQNLKSKCKQADQVVMVTIKNHGAKDCRMSMGNGKYMNAKDMEKNILEPLTKAGVKVVMNFDSCYSGCFVDQLKKTPHGNKVCMTSATRSTTIGYGSDHIISGTYDDTYPKYLARTKNPLKAHICASLWDPLNAPKVASTPVMTRSVAIPPRTDAIADVGTALGYPNLKDECPRLSNSFSPVPGVSEQKVKDLFSCPDVKNTLNGALRDEGETNTFLASVTNSSRAPGLDALKELANDRASLDGIKDACDIDLSKYAKGPGGPAVATPAPAPRAVEATQ